MNFNLGQVVPPNMDSFSYVAEKLPGPSRF